MRLSVYLTCLALTAALLAAELHSPGPLVASCLAVACAASGAIAGFDLACWAADAVQEERDRLARSHALARTAGRPDVFSRN